MNLVENNQARMSKSSRFPLYKRLYRRGATMALGAMIIDRVPAGPGDLSSSRWRKIDIGNRWHDDGRTTRHGGISCFMTRRIHPRWAS